MIVANIKNTTSSNVWRSRGYLPHYDNPGLFQLITFRLFDSLPASKLIELRAQVRDNDKLKLRRAFEDYLDAGAGECFLRDARVAELAQDTLLHFDEERYRLLAWVIMPNHIHVLVQLDQGFPLEKIVHSWKSYIANQANKLLGRSGQFFQREYFDRFVRDENHYRNAVLYVENNPVKAKLVRTPEEFCYSSARFRKEKEDAAW